MEMPGRTFVLGGGYRYGFNGQEASDLGSGQTTAKFWEYDARLGRRWNVEPLITKYPNHSSYLTFANSPIQYSDIDGKDIIVLRNSKGANNLGHGAVLIGDNEKGWTYISKDQFEGSAFGSQSKFVVMKFDNIEHFRNSVHNFETVEPHSTKEGKETSNLTFSLDSKGDKIQRYDQALYFPTTQKDGTSTDAKAIEAAFASAQSDYCLAIADCSNVITDALRASKDNNGNQIKDGEANFPSGNPVGYIHQEAPNVKFNKIENRNKSDIRVGHT
jgi:hypothetical protein